MSSANQQRFIEVATQEEDVTTTVGRTVVVTVLIEVALSAREQLETAVEVVKREEESTQKDVVEDKEFKQTLGLSSQPS